MKSDHRATISARAALVLVAPELARQNTAKLITLAITNAPMSEENLDETSANAERLLKQLDEPESSDNSSGVKANQPHTSNRTIPISLVSVLLACSGLIMLAVSAGILYLSRLKNDANTELARESPQQTPRAIDDLRSTPSAEQLNRIPEPVNQQMVPPQPVARPPAVIDRPDQTTEEAEMIDPATRTIYTLYSELSNKNFDAAAIYYGPTAESQFIASFFSKFDRVTVSDLQKQSITGSIVNLIGDNTYVWPDGSSQVERRTYTVDVSTSPAKIISSEFVKVLRFR